MRNIKTSSSMGIVAIIALNNLLRISMMLLMILINESAQRRDTKRLIGGILLLGGKVLPNYSWPVCLWQCQRIRMHTHNVIVIMP